jgi:membrane protease YdiL (CAAX protease family)
MYSSSSAAEEHRTTTFSSSGLLTFAFGLIAAIIVAEYAARRLLAPTPPVIGSPVVNDMLAAALCYIALVAATAHTTDAWSAFQRAAGQIVAAFGSWLGWVGGLFFFLSVVALMFVDQALWGGVTLPSFSVPPSETVLFAAWARPLSIAALLLVNGLVIPIAEERLWRGPALLVTAVLFSAKHAIVDASPGRLIALMAGGLVLGYVAHRAGQGDGGRNGWQTAAVAHILANTVATGILLVSGAGPV